MVLWSYLRAGSATTVNVILNAATLGRYVWLEGRVSRGVFMNWARRFRYTPEEFVRPATEEEILDLVKRSGSLRVFGSAHSFNAGVVSGGALVSLDDYSGLIHKDRAAKQITVKGGTRVREVVKLLLEEGWAFRALPSHDAQSIAGILSTDVHGTGRDWGFVSESVTRLELVDGRGEIHECRPGDDLFRAAIGGIGAVGVITSVTVQGVERFSVEQRVQTKDISFVESNLDRLLDENDHLSLYLFPFTQKCRVNMWNRTRKARSPLGGLKEFLKTSADALLAAWIGNFFAHSGLLAVFSPLMYGIELGSHVVMESNKAFNRTIYHLHQELEFTVPFEDMFETARHFIELYEEMYPSGLPYTLFEVRFTPGGHDLTMIGAGRERRCAWIDLVCTDSRGFERYYAAAEELVREIGARPHLGKYCEDLTETDLAKLHQENFTKFQNLVEKHDTTRKFANEFTRRLFGEGS
jgi:FAD/FMN-containing dehydrogenase